MAEVSIASQYVSQANANQSQRQDNEVAHKNKYGTYTSDGGAMEVTLGLLEGYCNVTTTSGGAITLNLPDVAEAKDRTYVVSFTKDTTDLTVVYTGTGTGNLTVSATSDKTFVSSGTAWTVS